MSSSLYRKFGFYWTTPTLLILCGLYFIYSGIGVFIGTLRTDEIYFLTTATWLSDPQQTISEYRGSFYVFFRHLLNGYWILADHNVAHIWGLRAINFVLAIAQSFFIYSVWHRALQGLVKKPHFLSIFIAAGYFVMCASFRGYEIRPEILPMTFFLYSVFVSVKISYAPKLNYWYWFLIISALMGLVVASSVSVRFMLPCIWMYLALAWQAFQKQSLGEHVKWWASILAPLLLALFINGVWINLIELYFVGLLERSNKPHFDWLRKLTIGENSYFFLLLKILLSMVFFSILMAKIRQQKIIHWVQSECRVVALVMSLISFYLFLILIEFRPFEYVRSIEWGLWAVLVPCTLPACASYFEPKSNNQFISALIMMIVATIGLLSSLNLYTSRNTWQELTTLAQSDGWEQLSQQSDDLVISRLVSGSLLDQVRGRQLYCQRHPQEQAVVHDWSLHPICMRDAGSLAYSEWEGSLAFQSLNLDRLNYINLAPYDHFYAQKLSPNFQITKNVWHRVSFH